MPSGLPDWYKGTAIQPTSCSYIWSYMGGAKVTTSNYNTRETFETDIRTDLGGKKLFIFSFSANGYLTWISSIRYTQTYYSYLYYVLEIYDIDGNCIGGVSEIQTPIIVDNVDRFKVAVCAPLDRIATANNPSYYSYSICFHVAYRIK